MAYSVGSPIVAANIVTGDTATAVAVGDNITVTEQRGASEREVTGKVLAIELGNKPFYGKRAHEIYDGVPVSEYNNPVATMIQNAANAMEVNALLVEVPAEEEDGTATHTRVNVGRIKAITNSGPAADDAGEEEEEPTEEETP